MSIKAMTHVWEHSAQKSTNLLMLLAIADHCNDEGACYPSITRLAHKCRLQKRGAQKVIRKLEEEGELSIIVSGHKKNNGADTNVFYLNGYRDSLDLPRIESTKTHPPMSPRTSPPMSPRTSKPSLEPSLEPPLQPPAKNGTKTGTPKENNGSSSSSSDFLVFDFALKELDNAEKQEIEKALAKIPNPDTRTNVLDQFNYALLEGKIKNANGKKAYLQSLIRRAVANDPENPFTPTHDMAERRKPKRNGKTHASAISECTLCDKSGYLVIKHINGHYEYPRCTHRHKQIAAIQKKSPDAEIISIQDVAA